MVGQNTWGIRRPKKNSCSKRGKQRAEIGINLNFGIHFVSLRSSACRKVGNETRHQSRRRGTRLEDFALECSLARVVCVIAVPAVCWHDDMMMMILSTCNDIFHTLCNL